MPSPILGVAMNAKKSTRSSTPKVAAAAAEAAAPAPAVTTIVGHIDAVNESGIYGWAYDSAQPDQTATLKLHIDGVWIQDVACGALRPDVGMGGHPTSEVGFRVKIPQSYCDGEPHRFSFRDQNENVVELGEDDGPPASERAFQFSVFFDEEFYAAYHLSAKVNGGMHEYQDWKLTGTKLGYYPNADAMLAEFQADGFPLPADFSARDYRFLNPDLESTVLFDWQAVLHYLKFGRQEARTYKIDSTSFILDLYFDGKGASKEEISKTLSRPETYRDMPDMLLRNGVTSGAFLKQFKVEDYVSYNLPLQFSNKTQCIRHFVETGRQNLAPISFGSAFDPDFYRDAAGLPAKCSDPDAYLHWLNVGAGEGIASCPHAALRKLGLTQTHVYPRGFDPKVYTALNPDVKARTRWDVLEAALDSGIAQGRPGCQLDETTCEMYRVAADRLAIQRSFQSARGIYEKVLLEFPHDTMTLRHYADCLLRLDQYYQAMRSYKTSIELGTDNVWTHINLSSCYVKLQRWPEAADALRHIADLRPGDVGLQLRYSDIVRQAFDSLSANAMVLAQKGFYAQARAIMEQACSILTRRLHAEPVAPFAPGGMKHVAIIADLGLPQCKFYRVTQKCEQLTAAGIDCTVFNFHTEIPKYLADYGDFDAVILYRVSMTPLVVKAVNAARRSGKPVFYEIDDLMFDETVFPDSFKSYGGQITHDDYAHLVLAPVTMRHVLSLCDFAIASTPTLAAAMEPLTRRGKAFVHRNGLGSAHHLAMMAATQPRSGEEVCVFYGTGTKAHNADFERELVPCLIKLLAKHGKAIRLVICGYLTLPSSLDAYADQITHVPPIWELDVYWDVLRTMSINIAVLSPGKVADCKSEIKWLEAGMLGVPSVVTATETYREVIIEGDTGLLIEHPTEWFGALDSLISSSPTREAMGARARQEALANYDISALSKNIAGILREASGEVHLQTAAPRLRVLIVNVFFPPQSFGGATRVVADNITDMLEEAGDELDIEVFTSVEGGNEPYHLTSYRWNGIRVTGISTPNDPDIDHKVTDDEMGRAFKAVVLRFKPDVIHFHCIQRLTTSLCSVATACGVPYVITAHDSWWLSDKQFVIDEFGHSIFYHAAEPLRELQLNGDAAYRRMITKRKQLQGASKIFAVSAPFAEIYTANGVERVVTIENGSPPFVSPTRSVSADGRVRLGHIGGTSFHKGYNLILAVLSGGDFPNLHHLQIDHSLEAGTQRTDRWGTTDVVIKSTVPQAEVGNLYADIDVLLAPSIWPESYGLVVREALSAGCWVIASDRGAIGHDIPEGAGFVIDVGSHEPLREVLQRINDDASRYTRPPEVAIELRSAREQALELLREYRAFGKRPADAGDMPKPDTAAAKTPTAKKPARRSLPAGHALQN